MQPQPLKYLHLGPLNIYAKNYIVTQMVKRGFQCWRPRFDSWVRKFPWRSGWLHVPVFLPGESHGQRSLMDYSPWGYQELNKTEWLSTHSFTSILSVLCLITSSILGNWYKRKSYIFLDISLTLLYRNEYLYANKGTIFHMK